MDFCLDTSSIWQFIGYILMAVKIVIPIIIIIMGIIDLAKAVVSNDEKAINKSAMSVVKRLIAGIAIFFVPTIIDFVFSLINDATAAIEAATICENCLLNPSSSECESSVKTAEQERAAHSDEINKDTGTDYDYDFKYSPDVGT